MIGLPDQFPIIRHKLYEQVAEHLQNEILSGVLKPGERLPPERDLQATFGVGRPAIREALITLQRSGLVEIGNGAPARVVQATVAGVVENMRPAVMQMLGGADGQKNLQGVRLFMEIGLVRHAAEFATKDDLRALTAALEANRRAGDDVDDFMRTDVAFHFVLACTMGNPAFLALHDAMSGWLREQRAVALGEPGEPGRGYAAHVHIHDAVTARDPDAAEAAMRAHLQSGWVAFWNQYQDAKP